jgi:hypothetical protein
VDVYRKKRKYILTAAWFRVGNGAATARVSTSPVRYDQIVMKNGGRACKPDSPGRSFLSVSYAESTDGVCHLRQRCHAWQVLLHVFCTFFLLSIPCLAQQSAKTYRLPFHSVNGLILLDATVNNKPAMLLLDTGAQYAMVDKHAIGLVVNLHSAEMSAHGVRGEYVRHHATIDLAGFRWERNVMVVDLSQIEKAFGAHIDGYVGEDLLREFSAVRIDYKAQTVTLEN